MSRFVSYDECGIGLCRSFVSMLATLNQKLDFNQLFSKALFKLWLLDANRKLSWIEAWMKPAGLVLEIGSGPGSVYQVVKGLGHQVTALDVEDQSLCDSARPIIFDGQQIPFDNDKFDTALVLTVLHHAQDPDQVLREAARVASRVIVIEDIYFGKLHRRLTEFADSLCNFEFLNHPHNNRSHSQWLETFQNLKLNLRHQEIHRIAGLFFQAVYVLDTP